MKDTVPANRGFNKIEIDYGKFLVGDEKVLGSVNFEYKSHSVHEGEFSWIYYHYITNIKIFTFLVERYYNDVPRSSTVGGGKRHQYVNEPYIETRLNSPPAVVKIKNISRVVIEKRPGYYNVKCMLKTPISISTGVPDKPYVYHQERVISCSDLPTAQKISLLIDSLI